MLLSILSGHHRYAHISAIRSDGIHPELIGMDKFVSAESARRALSQMKETAALAWLDSHPFKTTKPLLNMPRVLDRDATVKCLYGKYPASAVGLT